jgi:hypothetical protein
MTHASPDLVEPPAGEDRCGTDPAVLREVGDRLVPEPG